MTRNLAPERLTPEQITGMVVVSVIESVLGAVDWVLAGIPNPVPSSGQLRHARGLALRTATGPAQMVRRPLLAVIGTVDLLADQTKALDPSGLVALREWSIVDRVEIIHVRIRNGESG